jgi:serine/threonine protein kinase/tetratricopeptide (TPR) repeat protein
MTANNWEKVKEIFDSLADVPNTARVQVLQGLDDETRIAIEQLLENFDATKGGTGLLDNSPVPQRAMLSSVIARLRVFESGQLLLGRFEILKGLGRGGMGEVYEAFDQVLGERIAVKTIRFDLCLEPEIVARFKREVQRSRHVTHANVCRVYDLFSFTGPDSVEVSFMTMELIEGPTLYDHVSESGGLPEPEAKDIALQLFSGLRAAHSSGIIHRDFKCGNVLLSGQHGKRRAVITDFGLARLMTPDVQSRLSLSSNRLEGTLAYLAPELLSGQPATKQSDIYALGVVLFRMVTGHYPFTTDPADLSAAVQHRLKPPHLGDTDRVRDTEREISDRWDLAIQACLEPDTARRADSVVTIEQLLTGTVRPTRADAARKLGRLMRRRDILIGGGAAGAAAAAIALYKFVHDPFRNGQHVKTLVEDFTSPSHPALGRAVRTLFRIALAHSPHVSLVKATEVNKALEDLDSAAETVSIKGEIARDIARRLAVRWVLGGEIARVGAGYRLTVSVIEPTSGQRLGPVKDSVEMARDLPTMVQRVAVSLGLVGLDQASADQPTGPQIKETWLDQADTGNPQALERLATGLEYFESGEIQVAQQCLEEATRLDGEFAVAFIYLAVLHSTFRREDLAFAPALRAYNLRGKVSGRQYYRAEELFYRVSGDYDRAAEKRKVLAGLYPNDLQTHRDLAQMWAMTGHPNRELQEAQKTVGLAPQNGLNLHMLASAYADVNQFSEAARVLDQADKILPRDPFLLAGKGYVRLLQSDTEGALDAFKQLERSATDDNMKGHAHWYEMKALLLGGRIGEARSQLELQLPVLALRSDQANEDQYRYWLSQLYVLTGEGWRGIEHATALVQRDAIPPNLFALRATAELAWLNHNSDILDQAHQKIKSIADKNPSTRSKGICAQCEGLQASLDGRTEDALARLASARAFWPDISCLSTSAETLSKHGANRDALDFYKQVLEAKWAALRFECVLVWVRSVAMTGHLLKALGQYREAVSCFDEFLRHWGDNKQLPLVHGVIEARKDCLRKVI